MKKTSNRTSASRMLTGVVMAAVITTTTPAMAQATDGGASAQEQDIASVDGLRVARTQGTLAVLNWRRVAGADSYQVLIDQRELTSENGWATVRFLEPLQTYTASVRAVVDGAAGPAEEITFTTADVTLRDPRIEVDSGVYRLTSEQVPFAWQTAPFTTIELFRDGVRLDPNALGDTTSRIFDRDVIPGETYVYQARLVSDASGAVGPLGPELTVTVPGGAPVITAPYADNSITVLRIEGLDPTVTTIEVERDGVILGAFPRSGSSAVSWFGDRSIGQFAPWVYRVRQIDPSGNTGPWSQPVTATFVGVSAAS